MSPLIWVLDSQPTRWRGRLLAVTLAAVICGSLEAGGMPADGSGNRPGPSPAKSESDSPESPLREADLTVLPEPIFDELMVIGGEQQLQSLPGSAQYLSAKELERQDYSDIHRILRQVPGVNIQDEDGYGLRPNIGMRGSGSERSSKITLLEDGVLIAPAPYSAPSAYYFPVTGRMESVEIRKGSSSIRHGPYTNGGVINLVSSSIPGRLQATLKLAVGEDSQRHGQALVGDSRDRYGWLVETYHLGTDGFKQLDGGGDTGFELHDYLAKLRFNSRPGVATYQALEIKLGYNEQLGNETYLGLSEADFRATPLRRYAASRHDVIDTQHSQLQLRHLAQPMANLEITTSVYRNEFSRNWHKLQSVLGVGITDIVDQPTAFAREFAILGGESDSDAGDLRLRNNRRAYLSYGLQSMVDLRLGTRHTLKLGARYHEDWEDRFQEEDSYQMTTGFLSLSALGSPGSQANRIDEARALALFAQDEIRLGRWSLTPGIRLEIIDFARRDYGREDPERVGTHLRVRENGVEVWIPGLGVAYQLRPQLTLFGGAHRGFAPPGSGSDENTQEEESVNLELGLRYARGAARLQIAGFYTDYENLLGRDTLSAGGSGEGDLFNGGEVRVDGLEIEGGYDLGTERGWRFGLPIRLAYTLTTAEFQNSFESEYPPWQPSVTAGDELPYLPEHQISAGFGVSASLWSAFLNASYVAEMRTQAGSGPIPEGSGTDEHLLFDISADYQVRPRLKLSLWVRNLTNDIYVAARRPAGARPGLPRTASVGVSWQF